MRRGGKSRRERIHGVSCSLYFVCSTIFQNRFVSKAENVGHHDFSDSDIGARFDIIGPPNPKLSRLFGYHTQLGEAKISDTSDQRTSMARKIIDTSGAILKKPTGGKEAVAKRKVALKYAKGAF